MRKLLRSDIHALFLDKGFRIISLFSIILGAFMPILGYINKIRYDEITVFEDGFFIFLSAFSFSIPFFVSLFLGKSFEWGTVRNKLTVGHKRSEVYFSFLFTSFIGTLTLVVLYMVPYILLGSFMLEKLEIPLSYFLLSIMAGILVLLSLTSLAVAITNNIHSRAISLVVTLCVVIALLMIGNIAVQMLLEPEMITTSLTMVDGEFVPLDPYPNPRYVKESQRWIWESIKDSTLGGQIHQITALECNWKSVSVYSIALGVIISIIGFIFFNKKDLK